MVTATTGSATFVGLKTGTKRTVSMYVSDVVGASVRFNMNSIASATTSEYAQFDEPVVLGDVAILTGPTVATGFVWQSGTTVIPNSVTMISPNLTTNPQRVCPTIRWNAGSLIGAQQF